MIVKRPRKKDRCNPKFFTEKMLDWPEGAVSAQRRCMGDAWEFTYREDVLRARRERLERILSYKRDPGPVRRAIYVWVFWCPGVAGFAFRGWWTYLVGIGGVRYHGRGIKGNADGALMERIMSLFPIPSQLRLYEPLDSEDWMEQFASRYQRGKHCGKPQGKAAVWAMVDGEQVIEILSSVSSVPSVARSLS